MDTRTLVYHETHHTEYIVATPSVVSTAMCKADLHLHTTYSDGTCTPKQLVEHVATATDLQVIAVTDHDAIKGAYIARDYAQEHGIDVIIGEEISSREGHILAYFIQERIAPGMSACDTIRAIHEQGGLAVAAHPYDWMVRSLGRYGLLERAAGHTPEWAFDAIETLNSSLFPRHANTMAHRAAHILGLPMIGGSDSHQLGTVGYGYTMCAGATGADIYAAITSGSTSTSGQHWSYGDLMIATGKLVQRVSWAGVTLVMRGVGIVS